MVSYQSKLNYNTDSVVNSPDDTFIVQVSDGNGGTANHAVNLTITPVADPMVLNQAAGLTYTYWKYFKDANALGGGYRQAGSGSFSVKPAAAYTTITLVSYTGPNQGKADVFIDTLYVKTLDFYSPTPVYQKEFVFSGLANLSHLVVIKPTGTKNPASTGTSIRVDGFKANGVTYDDNMVDHRVVAMWYGDWLGQVDSNAANSAYRVAKQSSPVRIYSSPGLAWKCRL